MANRSAHPKKSNPHRFIRTLCLVCAVAVPCALFGCGQPVFEEMIAEDTSSVESAAVSEDLSGSEDSTGEQGTPWNTGSQQEENTASASAAGSGKKTVKSTKKPAGNAALAKKWKADFKRLAESSGMDVSVSAVDLKSGTAATYHSDRKMLSASMIKLLIAETFLRQVSEGKHSLDDVYVLRYDDMVGGTGSLQGLGAGAEVTKREILQKMIAESDNVAANVLIDLCGMDRVNREAARLHLKNTALGRYMMDLDAVEQGRDNYTCADDLAKLLKMVYDGTFVNQKMSRIMLRCLEAQADNQCISVGLPDGTVFAHKTGALGTVRHDGGIVEGDKPFVIVVLCGGEGFSPNGAQEIMRQIGAVAYQEIQTT